MSLKSFIHSRLHPYSAESEYAKSLFNLNEKRLNKRSNGSDVLCQVSYKLTETEDHVVVSIIGCDYIEELLIGKNSGNLTLKYIRDGYPVEYKLKSNVDPMSAIKSILDPNSDEFSLELDAALNNKPSEFFQLA